MHASLPDPPPPCARVLFRDYWICWVTTGTVTIATVITCTMSPKGLWYLIWVHAHAFAPNQHLPLLLRNPVRRLCISHKEFMYLTLPCRPSFFSACECLVPRQHIQVNLTVASSFQSNTPPVGKHQCWGFHLTPKTVELSKVPPQTQRQLS